MPWGGPVEFGSGTDVDQVLPNTRAWPADRRWNEAEAQRLAESLTLHSYQTLRPDPAPYGPWAREAAAGTITDDSRHKIVLMRTMKLVAERDAFPLTPEHLAQQFLEFCPQAGQAPEGELAELCAEGMRQYRYAARWLLGERDLTRARPLERLWAGTDNCSGQMLLPPLAAVFPGDPSAAYLAAFAIDFVDAPLARDMAAALVAGLAAVLDQNLDGSSPARRWQVLLQAMRDTDPFAIAEVPFAGRPLLALMDQAEQIAEAAAGRPGELFRRLEEEGRPQYWWDAHFTLLVPLAVLHFTDFDPLAALHLTLDFRHDTDSYAQVLGCWVGAVCGEEVFPESLRHPVALRLAADYSESIDAWQQLLQQLSAIHQAGRQVVTSVR